MPQTAVLAITANVGGLSVSSQQTKTGDGGAGFNPLLAAALPGTQQSWTDADTCVITLGTGHGLAQNDKVDVYWAGGSRYGCNVSNVAGNNVTCDVGAGTNYPNSVGLAMNVQNRQTVDGGFLYADLQMIVVSATARASIDFLIGAGTSHKRVELAAGECWTWVNGGGITNPFSADIASMRVSNGDATITNTITIAWCLDATP